MKLIHLSDLHLGKRLHVSMIEDQKYILTQILNIIDEEAPQAVLIAGDVYDKAIPPAEAVELFDAFLVQLSRRNLAVLLISGNHDSPERLAFGGRLLAGSGVYISPVYHGEVEPVTLMDKHGPVNFYMLPFVKPAHVRRFVQDEELVSYTDAVSEAIGLMDIDGSKRNVLLTHQFVAGAVRCESEEISIGGSDCVSAEVFAPFDYVALGHIHGPQNIVPGKIRYCGTPLKYSLSEMNHKKSVTIVELEEKGQVKISTRALTPLHDVRELRGTYAELTAKENYADTNTEDYLHIVLTDEEDVPEAMGRLRVIYPNIMKLSYDNTRTQGNRTVDLIEDLQTKSPLELFRELYEIQNGQPMNDLQQRYAQDLIETIWEGEV